MPTDPTPTAADFEAARIALYGSGPADWHDPVTHVDHVARALATAREAGQDVEVGRRRGLIDRARAEADAAGYARGREESDKLTGDLQNLVRDTLIRSAEALGVEGADTAIDGGGSDGGEIEFTAAELSIGLALIEEAAEVRGRAEGLREAAGLARRVFGHADLHGLRDEMVRAIDRALTLTPPPTPEPMPPDDIAEQWEDCTGLPDCPGCRVRHPDAPGMCGGFAADTPPTPEPTQPCCGCDSAEEPADCECADYCPHDGPCQCDCHRGPTPASGCLTCGGAGSVPTGAYGETEERDERVACPTCDGDGGGAPEPTPSRRALPEQREYVAVGDVVTPANVGVLPVGTRVEQDLGYSETWVATLESPGSWLSGDGGRFADWDVPSADPKRPCTIAYLPPGERDGVRVPGEVDG